MKYTEKLQIYKMLNQNTQQNMIYYSSHKISQSMVQDMIN